MVAGKPLPVASSDGTWRVPPELGGQPGDRVLRGLAGGSWATVRGWFATGKVRVDGATRLLVDGQEVTIDGTRGAIWVHP